MEDNVLATLSRMNLYSPQNELTVPSPVQLQASAPLPDIHPPPPLADPVQLQAQASLPNIQPPPPLVDPFFFGLRNQIPPKLYRVCRDDEDPNNDIMCKIPSPLPITSQTPFTEARQAVNLHIHSGHIPTQFVSCTASPDVALKWAFYDKKQLRPEPQNIIVIDQSRIPLATANQMIDLRDAQVRDYFLRGKPQKDFAKGEDEVLFQCRIPKEINGENVFELWVNPPMPPPPK